MKIITGATMCVMLSAAALAQSGERKKEAVRGADFDYSTKLKRCAIQQEGDGVSVTAELSVPLQPDQRKGRTADGIAAAEQRAIQDGITTVAGLNLDIAASSGIVPSVTAHAINTKGTGATNGRVAGQACNVEPSPRGTLPASLRAPATPAATPARCSLTADGSGGIWTFTVPLAAFDPEASSTNYGGHVTLIRHSDQAGEAKIVAKCDTPGGVEASYDLAVGKKD